MYKSFIVPGVKMRVPAFLSLTLLTSHLFCSVVLANNLANGSINIHNASSKDVTAEVSTFGRVSIAPNQSKNVSYTTLGHICPSQTKCIARFYVDNNPVGSATINLETGKLISMNVIKFKVRTAESEQVLRSVVIQ